jgi:exodeoxyribonuclease-3
VRYSFPVKIATWNVNGIRARSGQVIDWIARDEPDVVCLQEIKARPDQLGPMLFEPEGYWCRWHGLGGYSGVAIFVKKTFAPDLPAFDHPSFDFEARIVTTRVGGILVASIYVPNGGKDYPAKLSFLKSLVGWAGEMRAADVPLMLCGDLNVAHTDRDLHPKERKAGGVGQRPEERALIDRLLAQGLVDVGRALDPDNENLYSWWAPWRNLRQRNIGWRIDYVVASQALASRAISCPVAVEVGTSDHAPVVATFADQTSSLAP